MDRRFILVLGLVSLQFLSVVGVGQADDRSIETISVRDLLGGIAMAQVIQEAFVGAGGTPTMSIGEALSSLVNEVHSEHDWTPHLHQEVEDLAPSTGVTKRYLTGFDDTVIGIDFVQDGDGTYSLTSWFVSLDQSTFQTLAVASTFTADQVGSGGVIDELSGHHYAVDVAATPCSDVCAEAGVATGLIGVTGCALAGTVFPGVGTAIGGAACGLAAIMAGLVTDDLCDATHGAAHIGCETTSSGAFIIGQDCELESCTFSGTLIDDDKNLHTKPRHGLAYWHVNPYRNFSITYADDWALSRIDAGTVLSGATYAMGPTRYVGAPQEFVRCATSVELFLSVGNVYLHDYAPKPGTAYCTY